VAWSESLRGFARWLLHWLTTTNHKEIGILYMVTSFAFLLVAGALALLFRIQLANPDSDFLTGSEYYQAVTVHGLIMLLWFASPFAIGLANYIVPLQIGARDLAFPRLNALSYWLYLFSGILILLGFLTEQGAIDVGWTLYAPLTSKEFTPSVGVDLAGLAIFLFSLSVTIGTINFLVTIGVMRAPGLSWFKMPMFTWSIVFTMILMLWAFPPLMVGAAILWLDRNIGTEIFSNPAGGALLWDHLFWFFGHPEVYILLFPALGAIADIVATFSGRPIYAKRYILIAFLLATALSFLVWMHHMFVTGTNLYTRLFYSITTIFISIPFEMATVSLIFTMYKGRIRFTVPMLFAAAAIFHFILGGATGVYLGSIAIDKGLRGTYWVVAHFHYILVGTMLLGLIAGFYYWFPKMTGRMYNRKLALLQFALSVVGVNMTFFPQFIAFEMPRRYYTYDVEAWLLPNIVSTVGAYILALSILVFIVNVVWSLYRGPRAPENPWGAWTLEWYTRSPPPPENFEGVPVITKDNRVVFVSEEVIRKYGVEKVVSGEVPVEAVVRGGGHGSNGNGHTHHYTIDPFLLGVASFLVLAGLALSKALLVAGAALLAYSLLRWAAKDVYNKFFDPLPDYYEAWPFAKSKLRTALWVLVAGEVMVFGSIFSAYFFIRFNPVGKVLTEAWPPGYLVHDVFLGLANTIILFTGTMLYSLGYLALRAGFRQAALAGFVGAVFFNVLFLVVKYFEWGELIAAGYDLSYGLSAQLYYITTGAHALHVFMGVLMTLYIIAKLFADQITEKNMDEVIAVGIYWGIVEIVWVFVFPLFYLV
jgi:cytochrome c oxidase subunit I+III